MSHSRRTNTGKRRDSISRRWRPWLGTDTADGVDTPAIPTDAPATPTEERALPPSQLALGTVHLDG
jgi:hypothetical protein